MTIEAPLTATRPGQVCPSGTTVVELYEKLILYLWLVMAFVGLQDLPSGQWSQAAFLCSMVSLHCNARLSDGIGVTQPAH